MSVKTIFTALSDQVRRLTGRSDKMSVSVMTEALGGVTLGVDASGLTASASDVIGDKTFIGSSGGRQTGTMVNNGAVSATLDATTKSYTVPAGYHNGNGKVRVVTQTKSVTPGAEKKTVYPDSGKLLSAVTVMPGAYTGEFTSSSTQTSIRVSTGVTVGENDMLFLYCIESPNGAPSFGGGYRLAPDNVFSYRIKSDGGIVDNGGIYTITYENASFRITDTTGFNFGYKDKYRWVLLKR